MGRRVSKSDWADLPATTFFASASTVGASNRLRIAISTSSVLRIRLDQLGGPAASDRPAQKSCRQSQPAQAPEPRQTASTGSPLRRARAAPARRRHVRRRKRSTVELAVRRQRQRINNHKCRRHHVVGQARTRAAPAAQDASTALPADATTYATRRFWPGVSSRAITTACATPASHSRTASISPGCNPEPAQLRLLVGPTPQTPKPPSKSPPRQIPRPVHPAARRTIPIRRNRSAVSPGRFK